MSSEVNNSFSSEQPQCGQRISNHERRGLSRLRGFSWGGIVLLLLIAAGGIGWQVWSPATRSARAVEPISTALRAQMGVAADLSEAFRYVAETLQPSVVRISSVTRARPQLNRRRQSGPQLPPGFPEEFRRFFDDERLSPFGESGQEPQRQGLGSGVIVTSDGYVLTNHHVVREADEVTVTLADEREFRATIVGGDPKTDLAVLKIDAKNLTAARLGNSDDMKVGQWVIAIGCPFGLEQTVTAGIISARGRVVGIIEGGYEDFLQTDAAINPGNSGGPLVNLKGEVIGINAAIESRTGGFMGIGFAIPTNLARSVMDALIKHGKVTRGWLGAAIQPLNDGLAESFGFQGKRGILIGSVLPKGPAEKAGLREGDIVTELNGRPVETVSQLRNGIAALPPHSKADLLVYRNGKLQHMQIVVGELEADEQLSIAKEEEAASTRELGITVQPLTKEIAEQIGFKGELIGVVVTEVAPGSLAEQGTLRPGDVIVTIGSTAIKNVSDYREALKSFDPKKGIRMQVVREGVRRFVFFRSSE